MMDPAAGRLRSAPAWLRQPLPQLPMMELMMKRQTKFLGSALGVSGRLLTRGARRPVPQSRSPRIGRPGDIMF